MKFAGCPVCHGRTDPVKLRSILQKLTPGVSVTATVFGAKKYHESIPDTPCMEYLATFALNSGKCRSLFHI